jgi:hypothetical protein
MKPSISIDERGVLLHMTDPQGHGFAVALNAETLNELGAQIAVALEQVKAPETRGPFLWNLARVVLREVMTRKEKGADGTGDETKPG